MAPPIVVAVDGIGAISGLGHGYEGASPIARSPDLNAEEVGLSLRTVRYYEEVGLLSAPTRTDGGFRLYGPAHLEQLRLSKQMKPLGLSIEQMRALLRARNEAEGGD